MLRNIVTPAIGGIFNPRDIPRPLKSENILKIDEGQGYVLYEERDPTQVDLRPKYILQAGQLLWGGGRAFSKNDNPINFSPTQCDGKFIYVKCFEREIYSDHFAKIPLFYYVCNDVIYFATSLLLLLKISDLKVEFSYDGLLFFYNYGFTSFDHFPVKHVMVLPGGSKLYISNNEAQRTNYFNLNQLIGGQKSNKMSAKIKLIDEILHQTTAETIMPYDHIGIALSGGVDSGYLAQKISESGRKFSAYTIGFTDNYNEFERIQYLSKHLGFKFNKIILTPGEILDNYIKVSEYASIPINFNNSILNFIYYQAGQDGVEILFDGDGADRLFLGMNRYLQLDRLYRIYILAKHLRLNKLVPSALVKADYKPFAKAVRVFRQLNNDFPLIGERQLSDDFIFDTNYENKILNLALTDYLKEINADPWTYFTLFSIFYTPSFFFHTPYELELKMNIVSNPHFWSDDLVKCALNIPKRQKLKGKHTKYVLRQAAKSKINSGYWNLAKIGLQSSYQYLKKSKIGEEFINETVKGIDDSDDYRYLLELVPDSVICKERLIPYFIWKNNFL